MINVKSQRGNDLLQNPRFFLTEDRSGLRRYPGADWELSAEMVVENGVVKKLSFQGRVEPGVQLLLESWAYIMIGKALAKMDGLTLRECEAWLRDRNSEPALENVPAGLEESFRRFTGWLARQSSLMEGIPYHFPSEKGPFRNLKLTDKMRELKGFLNSPDIHSLYQGLTQPVLLDVDELTVYVEVPYTSERERALFHELHALGVETFQEENLNFIPEA